MQLMLTVKYKIRNRKNYGHEGISRKFKFYIKDALTFWTNTVISTNRMFVDQAKEMKMPVFKMMQNLIKER